MRRPRRLGRRRAWAPRRALTRRPGHVVQQQRGHCRSHQALVSTDYNAWLHTWASTSHVEIHSPGWKPRFHDGRHLLSVVHEHQETQNEGFHNGHGRAHTLDGGLSPSRRSHDQMRQVEHTLSARQLPVALPATLGVLG
ncbi:hypothetical protein EXIGLDRAFT_841374 [Exidia glandulosa HHB12029]|uniref:Uncharacterized protein n=1 Tax=Exidia glandulosa HHB12029 TaxID=1314781 RepID=A0A165DXE1_EXIGL|nr:hypothetical protein EXIGLDRAFT_841374 [Exidia glandulosa HHB12029]